MPTNRTRVARLPALAPEALAWARSPDARAFFTAPESYPTYGAICDLPGVLPWWSLPEAWMNRSSPAATAIDEEERAFLAALYRGYRT